MKSPIDIGHNRTGIDMSPKDSKAMLEGARASTPRPGFDLSAMEAIRSGYSQSADPLGTVPPPMSLKGKAKTGMQKMMGNSPTVFLDLMADRLAFERTGTRLYEALLLKFDASDPHPGGPTREELEQIHDEELQHFGMLGDCIKILGADPTVVTPTADVDSVASMGAMQVLTDPRSTLTECLHVIHMLELVDNDAWEMLADLGDKLGHKKMAEQFRTALAQEQSHLLHVRAWIKNAVEGQAGVG